MSERMTGMRGMTGRQAAESLNRPLDAIGRKQGAPREGRKRRGRFFSPMRLAACGATLAGLVIVANAVAFQTDRHPEPLFRPVAKAEIPAPPQRQELAKAAFDQRPAAQARAASVPPSAALPPLAGAKANDRTGEIARPALANEALHLEIQRELAKRGFFKGEPDGKPGPRMVQAIRDFQFSRRVAVDGRPSEALLKDIQATRATMKDELLDLVKRASGEEASPRTVRDIQRALNKAGYGPLTEDGQWGPTTRAALTRFEQDNRLPPKGEPRGSSLRALASISGMPIAQ